MPGDLLPFQATETTPSNGLRGIVVPAGIVHLFEYMMFRGTIAYDAPKPPEVLAEDEVIGARNLGLTPERVRVTPVTDVFAR